jgi:hypothetical protein
MGPSSFSGLKPSLPPDLTHMCRTDWETFYFGILGTGVWKWEIER